MTDVVVASDALHERVRRFIASSLAGQPSGETFEDVARAIALYQERNVEPFARLVHAASADLRGPLDTWPRRTSSSAASSASRRRPPSKQNVMPSLKLIDSRMNFRKCPRCC